MHESSVELGSKEFCKVGFRRVLYSWIKDSSVGLGSEELVVEIVFRRVLYRWNKESSVGVCLDDFCRNLYYLFFYYFRVRLG